MREVLVAVLLLGSWPLSVAAEDRDPSLLTLTQPAMLSQAPTGTERATADRKEEAQPVYRGGRGLITLEGVTGMFLNPTSGTPVKGQITAQYCAAMLEQNDDTEVQHTAMLSFGVTDWLEVGVFGRASVLDQTNDTITAGGPLVRLRLLKDEKWWPELAIGGLAREGKGPLTKRTLFVAASKGVQLPEASPVRSLRAHVGFRQLWQERKFAEEDVSIGYVGGEIELPLNIFLVGEVSTRDPDAFKRTPSAVGVQVRHPSGLGFSLAAVQSGGDDRFGVYIGIGINFLK